MGGKAVAAVISIGLISAIKAIIWLGSRVIETMGDDQKLLEAYSRAPEHRRDALRAIVFQCAVSTLAFATHAASRPCLTTCSSA